MSTSKPSTRALLEGPLPGAAPQDPSVVAIAGGAPHQHTERVASLTAMLQSVGPRTVQRSVQAAEHGGHAPAPGGCPPFCGNLRRLLGGLPVASLFLNLKITHFSSKAKTAEFVPDTLCQGLTCVPQSGPHVGTLSPSTSACDCAGTGLYGGDQVKESH